MHQLCQQQSKAKKSKVEMLGKALRKNGEKYFRRSFPSIGKTKPREPKK
jgi:hypothetical protein